MRKNLIQYVQSDADGRRYIENDWYHGGIPPNVRLGENVYLDTSYAFEAFHSEREIGFRLGAASGVYNMATFIVGESGMVEIGSYTVLGGTFITCNASVTIGSHCLLAWGSVITDSWADFNNSSIEKRRAVLRAAAADSQRRLLPLAAPRPVILEDNVWVGFDAVILPGVVLGRGSIVGSKTVVAENVPPYAVVAGNPARIIKYLDADDTAEAREKALREHTKF